jgi:hypothetical protein
MSIELTKENLQKLIIKANEESLQLIIKCEHKDQFSNPYEKESKRLTSLLQFVETGVDIKYNNDGYVIVEKKFLFALRSYKWKVIGKNIWYKSRGPSDFIERFVKEKKK